MTGAATDPGRPMDNLRLPQGNLSENPEHKDRFDASGGLRKAFPTKGAPAQKHAIPPSLIWRPDSFKLTSNADIRAFLYRESASAIRCICLCYA